MPTKVMLERGKTLGGNFDAGQGCLEFQKEVIAQAGPLFVVPGGGLDRLELGCR